jgi:hypothetical protein
MEKAEDTSYPSAKALGQLFRRCVDIIPELAARHGEGHLPLAKFVPSRLLDSMRKRCSEAQLVEARALYQSYGLAVRRLAARCGVRSDHELALGEPMGDLGGQRRAVVGQTMRASWRQLQAAYRGYFRGSEHYLADRTGWCAAWWSAAHEQQSEEGAQVGGGGSSAGRGQAFPSFPWVAVEALCELSAEAGALGLALAPGGLDVAAAVANSALEAYARGLRDVRAAFSTLQEALRVVRSGMERAAGGQGQAAVEFEPYGSAALLTCHLGSDLDVCVLPSDLSSCMPSDKRDGFLSLEPAQQQRQWMEMVLVPAMSSISTHVHAVLDAEVPLVRAEVETDEGPLSVDLCLRQDGLEKARHVLRLYRANPWAPPLFYLLLQWARAAGLVRSGEEPLGLLPSGVLQAMTLDFCGLHIPDGAPTEPPTSEEVLDDAESRCLCRQGGEMEEEIGRLGQAILRFMRAGAELRAEPYTFTWPVKGSPTHRMDAREAAEVAKCCRRALHCLGLSRSWEALLNDAAASTSTTRKLVQTLPPSLSRILQETSTLQFHAERLQMVTEARVEMEVEEEGGPVRVSGEGTPHQIAQLRVELMRMRWLRHSLRGGKQLQRTGAYFMEGCTFFLVRGKASRHERVLFEPAPKIPHQRHHGIGGLSMAQLMGPVLGAGAATRTEDEGWRDEVASRLRNKVTPPMKEPLGCSSHHSASFHVRSCVADP